MTSQDVAIARPRLTEAVHQNRPFTAADISERLFTALFSGLVYPQIWEDPDIDMEAMALGEGHRVVTIASGGCDVLAYLTRSPARIDAVDLNASHIALNRLKLAAYRHLPSHAHVFRLFGGTGNRQNSQAYERFVAPHLDAGTRSYWEARNWTGRRRIAWFDRDFYQRGLLGLFIAAGHFIARRHGVDPTAIMEARSLGEQRRFFEQELSPIFRSRVIRFLTSRKASLFCLGIPPAQYDSLITAGKGSMADVLEQRLEKLACHFPLSQPRITFAFPWLCLARDRAAAAHSTLSGTNLASASTRPCDL